MPELRAYLKHEVPRDIACQIRSYIRVQWPDLNRGLRKIWTPPPGVPLDRMTFVLVDDEMLISHAEASFRSLAHGGEKFEVGGLSAVFTYPAHRGSGAGEQVVRAATEYLLASRADLALLFCGDRVRSLYERVGWQLRPTARITFGDGRPFNDGHAMWLLISARARAHDFDAAPFHVGPNTW